MKKSMRRIISGILYLTLVAGVVAMPQNFEVGIGMSVSAEQTDTGFTYSIVNNEVTITGYTGTQTNIELPSEIGGLPVTTIGENAFHGNKNIKSVVIPEGVTTIKLGSFTECMQLKVLELPNSITDIEEYAIMNCQYIAIMVHEGSYAQEFLKPYGELKLVIEECSGITDDGFVYGINNYEVKIKRYIGENQDVEIPSEICGYPVTVVGKEAFGDLNYVHTVKLPDKLKTIEEAAFILSGLTSVSVPKGVTEIGGGAFAGCQSLTSVSLPNSLETIGNAVFLDCKGLSSISIPKSVTSIDIIAFGYYMDTKTYKNLKYTPASISGYEGSAAQAYAKENGIEFTPLEHAKGDINADGVLSVADIVFLDKCVMNSTEIAKADMIYADFNSDGKINSLDVATLKTQLLAE